MCIDPVIYVTGNDWGYYGGVVDEEKNNERDEQQA